MILWPRDYLTLARSVFHKQVLIFKEFKKNLKKCNGGQDFDQDMLEEIYNAIKWVKNVLQSRLPKYRGPAGVKMVL